MTLRVKFHKHGEKKYFDVSNSEIIFEADFMEKLVNAVQKRENYEAKVAGINEVHTSSGQVDHAPFFLVQLNSKTGTFEFLFKILPGEVSQLVGVNPEVDHARLKTLVDQTLQKRSTPVGLFI